jgi:hypothetical protein
MISLLLICLIFSHFISWYLLFKMAKLVDKRFDYLNRFISDYVEFTKHSKDI